MTSSPKTVSSTADYLGILSAFVCLIHCLAAPLLMGAAAHLHEHQSLFLWQEWNYLFLGLGLLAVWWSSRHTHHRLMRVGMWTTFGFLAAAVLMETYAEELHYLVYAASMGLIVAHVINLRTRFRLAAAAVTV